MLASRAVARRVVANTAVAKPANVRSMSWFKPAKSAEVQEFWPESYIQKQKALDPEYDPHDLPIVRTKQGAIVVNNVAWTLEWVLSSPPPLHSFLEPPIIVEWPEGEDGHDDH